MIREWLKSRKKRKDKSRRTELSPSDRLMSVELARSKILLKVIRSRYEMDKLIHERHSDKEYVR
jgi:hypothetical protein